MSKKFKALVKSGAKVRTKVIKRKGKKVAYLHVAIKKGKSVAGHVHHYKKGSKSKK